MKNIFITEKEFLAKCANDPPKAIKINKAVTDYHFKKDKTIITHAIYFDGTEMYYIRDTTIER